MDYYRYLEFPACGVVHQLPFGMQQAIFGKLSRYRLFDNYDFIKNVIETAKISHSFNSVDELVERIYQNDAINYADVGTLMYGSKSSIRKHFEDKIIVKGASILKHLFGKPYFVVSAHFSSFYIAAFAKDLFDEISIIRRFDQEGRSRLVDRLAKLTQKKYNTLISTDPKLGLKIVRAIKSNQPVGIMFDVFYEDSKTFICNFMGKPCATPAGIPVLAAKLNVPIVMVNILKSEKNFVVEISEPIIPMQSLETDHAALIIANDITLLLEDTIRRYPEQWTFWASLPNRWQYAESVIEYSNGD